MLKYTLCAVVVGLSILGCDNNANRSATSDRTTSPSTQSPTSPAASTPSATSPSSSAAQMNASDQALAQRVTNTLREDSSLASVVPNMTVQANNGTVTLKGSVNSQQQRSDIESKVRSVTGVTQVINNIEVASASR
jgi:osmotically-inducible protein OsmY